MAGGTGLALQVGHRRSCDLDFFFPREFEAATLLRQLAAIDARVALLSQGDGTLHVTVDRTKASFLFYDYPLLFPLRDYKGISIADERDIACMKISAISSRGVRRYFVDLCVVSRSYTLEEILMLFECKYAGIEYSRIHILKSLAHFREAEQDHELEMMGDLDWEETKMFFKHEVRSLFRS